jgi:hypothetical protein
MSDTNQKAPAVPTPAPKDDKTPIDKNCCSAPPGGDPGPGI